MTRGVVVRVVVRGVTVLAALVALVGAARPAAAGDPVPYYRPPVHAPVVDPFRPPDQPWLPGNRGLEYDTTPGTVVHAIGPGLVVFAGPVAGHLYVTVLHPDGIRSSYSYLAALSVVEGDRVRGGQPVGVAGGVRFHLGARVGDTYIDPAALFGTPVGSASVFLVPLGGGTRPRAGPGPGGRSLPGGASRDPAGVVRTVGGAVVGVGQDLGRHLVVVVGEQPAPGP